jgi:hypothetical protein
MTRPGPARPGLATVSMHRRGRALGTGADLLVMWLMYADRSRPGRPGRPGQPLLHLAPGVAPSRAGPPAPRIAGRALVCAPRPRNRGAPSACRGAALQAPSAAGMGRRHSDGGRYASHHVAYGSSRWPLGESWFCL